MSSLWISRARRAFLKNFATVGGASVAATLPLTAQQSSAQSRFPAQPYEFLPWYTRRQNYRSLKQSSYDQSGGNSDRWPVEPGKVIEVFNQKGPGVITHISGQTHLNLFKTGDLAPL